MEFIPTILIVFAGTIVAIVITVCYVSYLASKTIFEGSDSPITMANVVLRSIMVSGQLMSAVAIIALVLSLIAVGKISTEVGVPVVSAVTGYLLGREFRNEIVKA